MILNNQDQEWLDKCGLFHREDGPALIYETGTKYWFKHGKRHREGGPAVEFHNGTNKWFLEDKEYTEQDYKQLLFERNLKNLNNI